MLTVNDLYVSYGRKNILENINFELQKGCITSVIGKNGSGKSTLLHSIAGIVKYTGDILYNGKSVKLMALSERSKLISMLPQKLNDVGYTVQELVSMGRNPYVELGKRLKSLDVDKINEAISVMGLCQLRETPVNKLSGGERQKAYIAMILAQDTDLIILDEPTSFIDIEYASVFSSILNDLKNKHNKTILTIYHDINSAIEFSDNMLVLEKGKTAFYGTTDECIKSGIIERIFNVHKIEYTDNGINSVFYK